MAAPRWRRSPRTRRTHAAARHRAGDRASEADALDRHLHHLVSAVAGRRRQGPVQGPGPRRDDPELWRERRQGAAVADRRIERRCGRLLRSHGADAGRGAGRAVRDDLAATIKDAKDLKGKNVGITGPGSSTDFLLRYLLVRAGVKPEDVSI